MFYPSAFKIFCFWLSLTLLWYTYTCIYMIDISVKILKKTLAIIYKSCFLPLPFFSFWDSKYTHIRQLDNSRNLQMLCLFFSTFFPHYVFQLEIFHWYIFKFTEPIFYTNQFALMSMQVNFVCRYCNVPFKKFNFFLILEFPLLSPNISSL